MSANTYDISGRGARFRRGEWALASYLDMGSAPEGEVERLATEIERLGGTEALSDFVGAIGDSGSSSLVQDGGHDTGTPDGGLPPIDDDDNFPAKDPPSLSTDVLKSVCLWNKLGLETERLLTGAIDIEIPEMFQPIDAGGAARAFMWSPYYPTDAALISGKRVRELIYYLDAPGTDSWYPGWSSSGRYVEALHEMIRLVYAYRSLIPDDWPIGEDVPMAGLAGLVFQRSLPQCESMSSKVGLYLAYGTGIIAMYGCSAMRAYCSDVSESEALATFQQRKLSSDSLSSVSWTTAKISGADEERDFRLNFDGIGNAASVFDFGSCEAKCEPESINCLNGPVNYKVAMCTSAVAGWAAAADYFLYWGNRAYWWAMTGCADSNMLRYLYQAQLCGRVALSCLVGGAHVLIHELVHLVQADARQPSFHCENQCCQEAIASLWMIRTLAYLGLPPLAEGWTGKLTTDFTTASASVGSLCGSTGLGGSVEDSDYYRRQFSLTNLGLSGSAFAYSLDGRQVPADCAGMIVPGWR